MKKIVSLISALALTLSISVFATGCKGKDNESTKSQEDAQVFSYTLNDDGESYTLSSYSLSDEALDYANEKDYTNLAKLLNVTDVKTFTIPATYEKKPVTKIAPSAFSGLIFVEKLVIPSSIKEIGLGAFYGFSSLAEVELPFVGQKEGAVNGNKSFGYIFGTVSGTGLTLCDQTYNEGDSSEEHCTEYHIPTTLKTVTVTGDVTLQTATVYTDKDGKVCAEGDEGAIAVKTEKVTGAMQDYAFAGCVTIENVSFTGKFEAVPAHAFDGCTALKAVKLNDDTATIYEGAFANCSAIRTFDFNKVVTIKDKAFNACTSLGKTNSTTSENVITIPAKEIGEQAFAGCTSIKAVNFTNTEKATLKNKAFLNCSALEKINGNYLEDGEYVFDGCNALKLN